MGASQSSTLNDINNQLNENITNVINNLSASAEVAQQTSQNLTLTFNGNTFNDCPQDFSQGITSSQNVSQVTNISTLSDLQTIMTNSATTTANSNTKSVNKFLALAFNSQGSNSTVINDITNIIKDNISNSNYSTLLTNIKNIQNGTFNFTGNTYNCNGQPMTFDQNSVTTQVVSQIAKLTADVLKSDQQIANAINTLLNEESSENQGLGDAIAGVFKSMNWMIVGLVVVVIILILFVPKIIDSLGGSQGISQIMQSAGPAAAAAFRRPQHRRFNMY